MQLLVAHREGVRHAERPVHGRGRCPARWYPGRRQNLGGAIGVAVASSVAASHFHTLIQHRCATAAALTGGFQLALWVCGLTGLAAVPAAVLLIRRTERPNAVPVPRAPEAAMAMVGE
jgi:hypothetical protein